MPPPAILSLHIEQGPKAGSRLECNAAAISTVGRARSNTLQISRDTGISQNHLRFQWSDGHEGVDVHLGWTATDAGSSNGTFINGVLVEPHDAILLHTGDLIKIGTLTTIRVEIFGVAEEGVAATKGTKRSTRKAACIALESHGKGMPTVAGGHACKADRTAGKALPVQECEGKQMDALEGEVCPGEEATQNAVKGHGKQNGDMENELYNGKQQNIITEGHGKQQDEAANVVASRNEQTDNAAEGHGREGDNITARRCRRGRHDINNEAEEGQGKRGCKARARGKHGINDVAKGELHNSAMAARDHDHETEIAVSSVDVDLSMTVEEWFQHMMEEGTKYLYKVSESIVRDVMLESKQFDNYVRSLR